MCSLRFENNFLIIEHVRIASKIISLLSNVFALLEENPIIEAFVRFRFDIVAITIMGYSGAWVKLIHEKN